MNAGDFALLICRYISAVVPGDGLSLTGPARAAETAHLITTLFARGLSGASGENHSHGRTARRRSRFQGPAAPLHYRRFLDRVDQLFRTIAAGGDQECILQIRTPSKGTPRLRLCDRDEPSSHRKRIVHEKHHGKRLVLPLQCPRRIEFSTKRPPKGGLRSSLVDVNNTY